MMLGVNLAVFSGLLWSANHILFKSGNGFTKGQITLLAVILSFILMIPLLYTLK